MELPDFKYHPNPVATGSIVPSAEICPVCGESKGFAYDGALYGANELKHVCPWCIADGSAHEKFGVEFTDTEGIGGYGEWEKVPKEILEEVAFRTPGFQVGNRNVGLPTAVTRLSFSARWARKS
jgi:uncharacterized protein CbrC (UPF0167 family)